jgi:putative cardiolipin synthase
MNLLPIRLSAHPLRALAASVLLFWLPSLPAPAAPAAALPAAATAPKDTAEHAARLVQDLEGETRVLLSAHPGQSAAVTLERGELSLLTRAWLAGHANRTLDVQYFIWTADNVGRLAMAGLLDAADRGVHVRVLVDDFMLKTPAAMLSAMDGHPNFEIKVYNPTANAGVGFWRRWWNLITGFRSANQRMHNKALIVDGILAVTGGRNLADEYFDFHHGFNFRDRDILVAGPVAEEMQTAFQTYWESPLSRSVADLLIAPDSAAQDSLRGAMQAYAADTANFAPDVRAALIDLPGRFPVVLDELAWGRARFITDAPGKNDGSRGLKGGGATTHFLADMLRSAKRSVTVQSPYLIPDDTTLGLFRSLTARGVAVRISTNSMANNDNLQAISGYRNRRKAILAAGVQVFEFKPEPDIQARLRERYRKDARIGPASESGAAAPSGPERPVFVIHAKTLVVDGEKLFVGTFNLDPRSMNLNTESGIYLEDARIAGQVDSAIAADMAPENSWEAAKETGDAYAPFWRRVQAWFWGLLPIESIV